VRRLRRLLLAVRVLQQPGDELHGCSGDAGGLLLAEPAAARRGATFQEAARCGQHAAGLVALCELHLQRPHVRLAAEPHQHDDAHQTVAPGQTRHVPARGRPAARREHYC
jgi:hypothetical protein